MRGVLALVIALVAAVALPASAQRIWPNESAVMPTANSQLPIGTELHSIAPGSVKALPGSGGVIFAGMPQDAKGSVPVAHSEEDAGHDASAPEEKIPNRQITAPDMKRAWLSTQLPSEVPRQDYSGWATITVDDQGKVAAAKITTSCGDLKVDKETLARLEREILEPAVETLADGTRVPVAYEGQWFFRWILLRSE